MAHLNERYIQQGYKFHALPLAIFLQHSGSNLDVAISNTFPFPCKTWRCLSDRIEEKGKCAELDSFHLRGRRQVDAAHNAVMVKASQVSPICPPFTLAPMHSNKAPPLSATVFSSMSKPSSLLLHIPNSGEFIVIEQQHHH